MAEPDIPALPQDMVEKVSALYIGLYERLTGEKFR
jgi:phosphoribosylaminoimidazole-succinocarboxamide synthase